MTIQEKFNKLWDYQIVFIQRDDKPYHWRLWLHKRKMDWSFYKEFEYVVEQPTIEQCLDRAIRYIETWEV